MTDNRTDDDYPPLTSTGQPTTTEDRYEEIEQKSPGERSKALAPGTYRTRIIGLMGGVALALLIYLAMPNDLASSARLTAAVAALMGVWWMTEALPIPATALLPLVLFPVFNSEVSVDDVGANYGDDIIFLFMGGFLIALAMQRWNLHRRIALLTVMAMGTKTPMMIGGFMMATAFLSMWVSNTATAVMMLPIGLSVLTLVAGLDTNKGGGALRAAANKDKADAGDTDADAEGAVDTDDLIRKTNLGTALMLGIAYAASIGSLATIIGTPPNTLLVGYLEDSHGIAIGFGQWMAAGLPLAIIFLAICWFLLTKVLFKPEIDEIPGGRQLIQDELAKLGPLSQGEIRVGVIFVTAALCWIGLPQILEDPMINDAGIAITAGVLLFLLPAGAARGVRLLDWPSAVKLPWGVLLLFGGGLALAGQFTGSGLTEWIGIQAEGLGNVPIVLLIAIIVAGVIFLTELTSNTATAATFLPVSGGVALGLGLDPMLLAIPVALAATCAFMLPVATPPNAVAYGSGYISIGQMVRGGVWLNVIGVFLVTATTFTLMTWVLGITV